MFLKFILSYNDEEDRRAEERRKEDCYDIEDVYTETLVYHKLHSFVSQTSSFSGSVLRDMFGRAFK